MASGKRDPAVACSSGIARHRIDMVIEGAGGRLALDLDGDAFHGPDRWDADRQRQAILERFGWTFHRIRGSACYRWPEDVAEFPMGEA